MPMPAAIANFDVANATVSVWLFKRSGGSAGSPPVYTGKWIATDDALDSALKEAVIAERARPTEVIEYGLLAQNNEGSVLRIDKLETHADLIIDATANEIPARKVRNLKHVQNTKFYVIKLVTGDEAIYAVRQTDSSWQSKKARNAISVYFADEQLGLDNDPSFTLSKYVDFFIAGSDVIISHKGHFESVLSYRAAHANDFVELQAEQAFAALFTDIAPLVDYIGTNKIQLRRACAIRQKGHYLNADFMAKLREHHGRCGLVLQFNDAGLLDPTPETCADIIRALLDHRLLSVFSENVYDVPDATAV